jgi:hypothetical protein
MPGTHPMFVPAPVRVPPHVAPLPPDPLQEPQSPVESMPVVLMHFESPDVVESPDLSEPHAVLSFIVLSHCVQSAVELSQVGGVSLPDLSLPDSSHDVSAVALSHGGGAASPPVQPVCAGLVWPMPLLPSHS